MLEQSEVKFHWSVVPDDIFNCYTLNMPDDFKGLDYSAIGLRSEILLTALWCHLLPVGGT